MDIGADSQPESPGIDSGTLSPDSAEQSLFDKQRTILQTYVDSVPYECESIEVMNEKLKGIIEKVLLCANVGDWVSLSHASNGLQYWLFMRYPLPKSARAKLVKLYYELCLIPCVDPVIVRGWVDMITTLVAGKSSTKKKLETSDLTLPWKPLWRVLKKELWPMSRIQDLSRNMVNILLYLAEQCSYYYPTSEVEEMLSTFLPLLTKESVLTMVPVMTSFLPLRGARAYAPALFSIWSVFNSGLLDDRFLELTGNLAEEFVAGTAKSEDAMPWKDVGIWTDEQWSTLMNKCLASMHVPIGAVRGASTTAAHADSMGDKNSLRIKKNVDRNISLARIIVYSISVDGPIKTESSGENTPSGVGGGSTSSGYLAGSKALTTLEKLITSTESYFHPSNTGPWTVLLSSFLLRLTGEFCKRWKEEEDPKCKTPIGQRLTVSIKRAFVRTLRTPTLLVLFAKDPISMSLAQGALRYMALLEPSLIMPQLLEKAYGGLEVVNETHRTTAVLSMLSGVALPLVSERIWRAGPKNLVPLLELCIPGIDLNDPTKTICATMFICAAVQHVKIGDLSASSGSMNILATDDAHADAMDVDSYGHSYGSAEVGGHVLSKAEERELVRDSTAGFADWIISLFRRVLALYENLPEEGGKKNTTGGKQEEGILKSIKSTLDVVCLHLSDPLFDLVLRLVYDYATTNTKSNAVRAFGQLVACLARVKPQETLDKFLPYCANQIKEELKHGASSVRTTSTHAAVPSDTTLHWNLAILRGCLGYGGPALLKHKDLIVNLLKLLIEKTKSERGYSSSGRLITRVLHTLSGVYPINSRFVNTDEWESPEFDENHNLHWGRLYEAKDVKVEWHVPSCEEITFIIEILDSVINPALVRVNSLLESVNNWDNSDRNDFCRHLHAVRAAWSGLPTIFKDLRGEGENPLIRGTDVFPDCPVYLDMNAGFALTDPSDPRYQSVIAHREHFGQVLHRAAVLLRDKGGGEDHIDAVLSVIRAIDVHMLEYALSRSNFSSLQKNYALARDLSKMWSRQKENSRLVFLKRAQVYHSGRVHFHATFRHRSALDDELIDDLTELSMSPYTRVRRHAQDTLGSVAVYYMRTNRIVIPKVLGALSKGTDPDRMKGALHVIGIKLTTGYIAADYGFRNTFFRAILESQHQEKPSIQKLVSSVHNEFFSQLTEELLVGTTVMPFRDELKQSLQDISAEFSILSLEPRLQEAQGRLQLRLEAMSSAYKDMMNSIVEIANRSTTHWRYVQMAVRSLYHLLRRDVPASPVATKLFAECCISPHPSIRVISQKCLIRQLAFVKIRSYSKNAEELWLEEWSNPLQTYVDIDNPDSFKAGLREQLEKDDRSQVYIDKLRTGFLVWNKKVKAYTLRPDDMVSPAWEDGSAAALSAIESVLSRPEFFKDLAQLWSQETDHRLGSALDLEVRKDNVTFMKTLAKTFERKYLDDVIDTIEPLYADADRYKQRAAAEMIAGVLRGSKHWKQSDREAAWNWFVRHMDTIFAQIKPDTLSFWEIAFHYPLRDHDPRRSRPLVHWLLSLRLDFQSDSAFALKKSLGLLSCLVDSTYLQFSNQADKYIDLFFDNIGTNFAEMCLLLTQNLSHLIMGQWNPGYRSAEAFIEACGNSTDPMGVREPRHVERIREFAVSLPKWKQERLPPPRVNQSQYDRVNLALLTWIWSIGHSAVASLIFPYVAPLLPEFLSMTELSDNPELQMYTSAVLYVLSAVRPPKEYIELVLENFISAITLSSSWKIKLNILPVLTVFFYRNLTSFSDQHIERLMDVVIHCLGDENVEVREVAAKTLSGLLRCSQRQKILPLRNRFVAQVRRIRLPSRRSPEYPTTLRELHSAILGLCALVESFPYSVESWMPPLTEVLAPHASDPPPISTTIRKCASEFKKTHQDTWHTDQQAFDEDQLQSLSNMLIGTSYYA